MKTVSVKQIDEMTKEEVVSMLILIEEAFGKHITSKGTIVYDYSTLFDKYNSIMSDIYNNFSELNKIHEFTENQTYGGIAIYLLNERIK